MNYHATLSTNLKPAIFSFFAGAGFLDLGFEKSGYDVVFVNEYHAPFVSAYQHSRFKMKLKSPMFGYLNCDVTDLLTGDESCSLKSHVNRCRDTHGPPCPDFSIGGKNKGRSGENGKLSKTYIDLICAAQPDFFVFENVKGLWQTSRHRVFYDELKEQLKAAGYILTDQLVNAVEYGAAQDRDRIVLVGFNSNSLRNADNRISEEFPWKQHKKFEKSILKMGFWPSRDTFSPNNKRTKPNDVPTELTVQHWFEKNDVENHPNSKDRFVPRAGLKKFLTIDEGDDSKKCFKRLHRWRYSPTAAYGNNEVHIHPFEARRISVAEALAIQSLPREFELPPSMTLTNKFKTIGNGVPFALSQGIASSLLTGLETAY
jgi:DNA (cytosine-5)-methyltransferase 1